MWALLRGPAVCLVCPQITLFWVVSRLILIFCDTWMVQENRSHTAMCNLRSSQHSAYFNEL